MFIIFFLELVKQYPSFENNLLLATSPILGGLISPIGGIPGFLTSEKSGESPFWTLPNVFVTPHCAGTSPQVQQRLVALFLDNFNSYRVGMPIRNIIDKKLGY